MKNLNGKETAERNYREKLSALAGSVGSRHFMCLGIANLGVIAGHTNERIESDILASWGKDRPNPLQVRKDIEKARKDRTEIQTQQAGGWRPLTKPAKVYNLGEKAMQIVPMLINAGCGASSASLVESSPIKVPTDPADQARLILATLFDFDEVQYLGDQEEANQLGKNIRMVGEWIADMPEKLPRHFMLNPIDGIGRGDHGTSYRKIENVERYRYCLIEFDDMPAKTQAEFFAGLIAKKTLHLVSLVWSGGKSIHGIVQVLPDKSAKRGDQAAAWMKSAETIAEALCNEKLAKEQRADRGALLSPVKLPRLPGAMRDNGKMQRLLWIGPRLENRRAE